MAVRLFWVATAAAPVLLALVGGAGPPDSCDASGASCGTEAPPNAWSAAQAGEEDGSLLAARISRVRSRNGQLSAAQGGSGQPIDLSSVNYNGPQGMWCVGINAVGFDLDAASGRHGDYEQPSREQLRYFHDQGANCFRLPMTWERMQSKLGDDFLDLVDGVDDTVKYITETLGDWVIIDPHNNDQGLRYNGVDANRQQFMDLWKATAEHWKSNPHAIFGLYNEPRYGVEAGVNGYFDPDALDYDGTVIEYWRQWMQEAIDTVRATQATNLILVPGLHWTTSRDWSGSGWWGETIDGVERAGNTRLAALTDPQNMIAYDVHQYMDLKFTGELYGCGGHDRSFWGGSGADAGLGETIKWAKRYNKKLMMTEIGSWPADDGTNDECKQKMYDYLQRMHDSGVFIGYQAWQFGCTGCRADQWTLRPYNLDWYRWSSFATTTTTTTTTSTSTSTTDDGDSCSATGGSCLDTECCSDPGMKCYEKDQWWAECKESCTPGINPNDPPEYQSSWSCSVLPKQCSKIGEGCRATGCCEDTGMKCYEKDQWWASCKASCTPGIDPYDPVEHQSPWSCSVLR